ncbi:hypothetical protein DR095_02080 [Mycoplasma flocculare]|uniref:RDD domain-containing protein n=3 Tax=Mesomycoplasma flocculare TaxID=2128 RepID=A0A0A8ECJ2_MESFC|nr:RDD family protein [Mesomycoplasma flocculare]MXR39614.1 hypothetical protein [Mycoplasma sp. MF12]AJC49921.1 hypothetical protein MYF_02085 [Mesomycoplasma flocculare ATCC 27399]ENX50891.1 hypothetical protein MFC_00095 [Mesomycoplasma flocculare ATCC 27716]MXR06018.1 hypothetical protein [Mesomycoplasma flocculare]MXR12458.1 hypothetical protein [Mesomycoplasma flocculare]
MKNHFERARFWRRFIAGLIDFALLFLLFLLFFYLLLILTSWAKWKFYFWILNVFFITMVYRILFVAFSSQTLGQFFTNSKIYFLIENLNFKDKIKILFKREIFLTINWIISLFIASLLLDLSFGIDFNFFERFKNQKLSLFQQISISFPALFSKVNFFFMIVNSLSILGSRQTTIVDRYSKTEIYLKKSSLKNNYLNPIQANFVPVYWEGN